MPKLPASGLPPELPPPEAAPGESCQSSIAVCRATRRCTPPFSPKNVNRIATGCPTSNTTCSVSGSVRTYSGRRTIVDDAKCNACHQELGTFTEDAFHAGQRNVGTTCSWCHTPNRASSGWTANADNMTHAIHAGVKRNVPYTWHTAFDGSNFSTIKYPGILARCEQCHIVGSYDFTNSASANAAGLGSDGIDKRQPREVASGTLEADASKSPYVTAGVDYGVRGIDPFKPD